MIALVLILTASCLLKLLGIFCNTFFGLKKSITLYLNIAIEICWNKLNESIQVKKIVELIIKLG
jgi:hypothetical protein